MGFSTIPLLGEAGTLERLRLLGDRPGDTSIEKEKNAINLSLSQDHQYAQLQVEPGGPNTTNLSTSICSGS